MTINAKGCMTIFVILACASMLSAPALADSYSISVSTGKSGYNSGEIVYISGSVTDSMNNPAGSVYVGIQVNNEKNGLVFIDQRVTNSVGQFSTSFRLPDSSGAGGEYTVYAAYGNTKDTALFDVDSEKCTENWNCSAWSSCAGGYQTRNCSDLNNCGTDYNKPETSRLCTCSQQDGNICSSSESCSGSWLPASDTSRCCSAACSRASSPSTGSTAGDDTTQDEQNESVTGGDEPDKIIEEDNETEKPPEDKPTGDIQPGDAEQDINKTRTGNMPGVDTPSGFVSYISALKGNIAAFVVLLIFAGLALHYLKSSRGTKSNSEKTDSDTGPRIRKMKVFIKQ